MKRRKADKPTGGLSFLFYRGRLLRDLLILDLISQYQAKRSFNTELNALSLISEIYEVWGCIFSDKYQTPNS
jgi:hypothetical protein